jgi:nitric oxide reductase NorE protein
VTTPRVAAGPAAPHEPVDRAFWLFLLADMTVFAGFFGAYLWAAGGRRAEFVADADALVLPLGLLNALVLVTSSWVVVRALAAHRDARHGAARRWLARALLGAGVFVAVKAVEYTLAATAGHGLTSSPFFSSYFVLTGLHLLHVAVGATLLVAWRRSLSGTPVSARFAEGAAGYWHMVDLLWLVLFALLYVGSHG